MSERPILFSDPMVRAILEGRKSVTRRVVKPQPAPEVDGCIMAADGSGDVKFTEDMPGGRIALAHGEWVRCPYGAPGDRLWVREAWQAVQYGPPNLGGRDVEIYPADTPVRGMPVLYRATDDDGLSEQGFCWRPSIHMPRWASRILLEVTEVRVEQLQEITAEDVIAEGVQTPRCGCEVCSTGSAICPADASELVMEFRGLWDSINAARGYGWDTNPWVWVVRFRHTASPGDAA